MSRLLAALVVLSALLPHPAQAQAEPPGVACRPAHRSLYLPLLVAEGETVPKSDKMRLIDNRADNFDVWNESTFTSKNDSAPPTPTGVSVRSVQDGILIEVNFHVDEAHRHNTFKRFNVYVRYANPVTDEDDEEGVIEGWFSDSSFIWQPERGGYTSFEIALSAESVFKKESAKTDWYICTVSTIYDDFSRYGQDTPSPLDFLYWLKIADFDTDENWAASYGTLSGETTDHLEGDRAIKVNMQDVGGLFYGARAYLNVSLDLSQDARFSDTDYVSIPVYISDVSPNTGLRVEFWTDGSNLFRKVYDSGDLTAGAWNFLTFLKSDLVESGSPNWADITTLLIYYYTTDPEGDVSWYFLADDWRIIEADPDDASAPNDTGRAWNLNGGQWHIYQGNRTGEPSFPYSLGMIDAATENYLTATVPKSNMPCNKMSTGIYFLTAGQGGPTFRIEDDTLDAENMLWARIIPGTGVSLVRFSGGTAEQLAFSADASLAADTQYFIGVDFSEASPDGEIIKVYLSTSFLSLWDAKNLKISHTMTAPLPDGTKVGLTARGGNVRFSEFRAGSPQTADYAHVAGYSHTAGSVLSGMLAWRIADVPLELDFTGTNYDTDAELQAEGVRLSDVDEPFPDVLTTTSVYEVSGSWSHSAGIGWQANSVVTNEGPAMLIPLMRPGNWELAVTVEYAPTNVNQTTSIRLGYIANSGHCGAYLNAMDISEVASELVCSLFTNDGDDSFTSRYDGSALAGTGERTYRIRSQNGCIGVWDAYDESWHWYEGRQCAGIGYTAAYAFVQAMRVMDNDHGPTYLKKLTLTYLA